MFINKINNLEQTKTLNYKGSIDPSVYNYLKEVKSYALKNPKDFLFKEEIISSDYDQIKAVFENILVKLKSFISKTHPDTKLTLTSNERFQNLLFPVFVNSKLDTSIDGYRYKNFMKKDYGKVSDKSINLENPELKSDSIHSINELNSFNFWTNELTNNTKPSQIDEALFKKRVKFLIDKASKDESIESSTMNEFIKLDKMAFEFNDYPIYKNKYKEIRSNIFNQKAESKARISTEMSKKELENFDIS